MPISKHNITKRGTQKQRAKGHDQYLADKFPHIFGHIAFAKIIEEMKAEGKLVEAGVDAALEAPVEVKEEVQG